MIRRFPLEFSFYREAGTAAPPITLCVLYLHPSIQDRSVLYLITTPYTKKIPRFSRSFLWLCHFLRCPSRTRKGAELRKLAPKKWRIVQATRQGSFLNLQAQSIGRAKVSQNGLLVSEKHYFALENKIQHYRELCPVVSWLILYLFHTCLSKLRIFLRFVSSFLLRPFPQKQNSLTDLLRKPISFPQWALLNSLLREILSPKSGT